jgi:hypothetical protein
MTGSPAPHGGGEHVGIEPEGITHEADRERDLVVEVAHEPPSRGDDLGRARACGACGATPTGPGGAQAGIPQGQLEQPYEECTRPGVLSHRPSGQLRRHDLRHVEQLRVEPWGRGDDEHSTLPVT